MAIKNKKIQEYEFKPLLEDGIEIAARNKKFEMHEFSVNKDEHQKSIKKELKFSEKNRFEILPIIRKRRGIDAQEKEEKDKVIQDKVDKKVSKIRDKAFKEGYERGEKEGREKVYENMSREVEEKLDILKNMISEVLSTKVNLLKDERKNIYKLIKTLTKWIILRELKNDGGYTKRLLEKLILEIQTKSNLLIKVNQDKFNEMPEVIENIKNKMGGLENVRIEFEYDIDGPGIIIESENGIINGTINQQFKELDRVFHSVNLDEVEDFDLKDYWEDNES